MQTSYGYSTPNGVPGGKVDLVDDEVVARLNEEEDGVLKAGMAVTDGTSKGHSVAAIKATAAVFRGVVVHQANVEHDLKGKVAIKKGATVGVMTKGKIWGRTATNVTPAYGDKAYVETSGNDAGTFTNASSGTTIETGATFGNATDDGIAVVEL